MKRPLPIATNVSEGPQRSLAHLVVRFHGSTDQSWQAAQLVDQLATEEPLEIRVVPATPIASANQSSNQQLPPKQQNAQPTNDTRNSNDEAKPGISLSITMRTPGDDLDLALGFLISEGILTNANDVKDLHHCGPNGSRQPSNIVKVTLADHVVFLLENVQRHFYTTSSCGICGKASLEAVELAGLKPVDQKLCWTPQQVASLPEQLRAAQSVFEKTGGLHASGVVDAAGNLLCLREDVGRHNALDKVIGYCAQHQPWPLNGHGIVVSGRASFELVQKAVAAGAEMMIAVGAPSSLAVALAERFGLTLVGFTSATRFNVYCHPQRIAETASPTLDSE